MNRKPVVAIAVLFAFQWLVAAPAAWANVRLPKVIGSHMVLQRDAELPFWGWADPGEEVTVTLDKANATTTADADGKWSVKLPKMSAGGPYTVGIAGKNKIVLQNVLVGEVWVCSGQSNMEWSVAASNEPQKETAAAEYPKIRLFHVLRTTAGSPNNDVVAEWKECHPNSISAFSAVAYFFGRHLHAELDVPVGLINTSWGGTRIEPWTPPVGFESVPKLSPLVELVKKQEATYRDLEIATVKRTAEWARNAEKAIADGKRIPAPPEWPGYAPPGPQTPTVLYNGMVHPLVPFAIRGAIWYQGESNRGEGMLYHEKMKALINGWRTVWNQGDFPFLFVQLAPYRYNGEPLALADIWQAQLATLSVPNTGMAVVTDIGNLTDIHPRNKQDVGKRLALWALAKTYGKQDLVYSGPLYKSMKVDGNKVVLSFEHVGSGLALRDDKPLSHFEIAGKNGEFTTANAEIVGETVVVSSEQVPDPVAVRFGWHQEAEPNLINKEGLPASPFNTTLPR